MTFDEWWAQFCRYWDAVAPNEYRPPQIQFFDYFEDRVNPYTAVMETLKHLEVRN